MATVWGEQAGQTETFSADLEGIRQLQSLVNWAEVDQLSHSILERALLAVVVIGEFYKICWQRLCYESLIDHLCRLE